MAKLQIVAVTQTNRTTELQTLLIIRRHGARPLFFPLHIESSKSGKISLKNPPPPSQVSSVFWCWTLLSYLALFFFLK